MSKIAPEKIFVTTSEMTNILAVRRHDYDVEYVRKDIAAKDTIARVSAEVEKIKNRLCADITLSGMNEKHYALPYIQRIAHFLSELEKEYSNE